MTTSSVIGIDLGTSFSCVGVFKNGKVEIVANKEGTRITPSVVAFKDGQRLVGDPAKSQSSRNPENTIFAVKRLIGRQFEELEVQKDLGLLPYKVVENKKKPIIELQPSENSRRFDPEQISGFLLREMKETAELYLGQDVKGAVITVPAYFNDAQRKATKNAAKIAKFDKIRIINEIAAAAIAYGLENVIKGSKTVLVFDLGGGTLDVLIVKVRENSKFEVMASTWDTHLGGDDFDKILLKHFADEFEKKHNLKVSDNAKALSKLRSASEKAKIDLSNSKISSVEIDSLMNGIDFTSKVTRAKFEHLCEGLFNKTIKTVERALEDAKLSKLSIDDVVLVGGSTRIPKVQQLLSEFFENKEIKSLVNPDEAVAYGAAIYATKCFEVNDSKIEQLRLADVTPEAKTRGMTVSTSDSRSSLDLQTDRCDEKIIVSCGKSTYKLHLGIFTCSASHVKCIECDDGSLITPKELIWREKISKEWKRAVIYNGTSLRTLITKQKIKYSSHSKSCRCIRKKPDVKKTSKLGVPVALNTNTTEKLTSENAPECGLEVWAAQLDAIMNIKEPANSHIVSVMKVMLKLEKTNDKQMAFSEYKKLLGALFAAELPQSSQEEESLAKFVEELSKGFKKDNVTSQQANFTIEHILSMPDGKGQEKQSETTSASSLELGDQPNPQLDQQQLLDDI